MPPITVVGIGEDGLDGLSPAARALVDGAEVLVGGGRHLAKVPDHAAKRLDWSGGFGAGLDLIRARAGRRIVVLASGDPLYFGVGATLIRHFGAASVLVVPAPGSVSLACARLGWSIPDVAVVTIHGRPKESLIPHLAPGVRVVALSQDGDSPAEVARLLTEAGFGPSAMAVLEHLGGAKEHRVDGVAGAWDAPRCADLNIIAIDCALAPGARALTRRAGLPDDAFEHDGQITKREIRALTLSSLAPLPGQTLWDLGAGSGSVAIEWMRAHRSNRAVAVERDADRAARIARNAARLGVPGLEIETRDILDALHRLDGAPDAVFVGGAVGWAGVLAGAWDRLVPGGRMAANAVTAEGAAALTDMHRNHGGELIRIQLDRSVNKDNDMTVFESAHPLTHWTAQKPAEGDA
ncbi:MAG: precorrin-6y C5,15-methyltransferase (decarboxylating) subunit CbiE [Alphaproteobacteria bacterium]|nr:precorrin-6y C5,15-methyltransferase (decarboxylating) subunit CbiE [Alphaproteobacteria bacterium]